MGTGWGESASSTVHLTVEQVAVINNVAKESCETCKSIARDGGMGPSHCGSRLCRSGSLASGGKNSHCTCDVCF